ncbi:MAG TPA: GNAT family N-acetyltransferase [Povalibacter sp.]|uniref:GNAT family N-acetyltransferase n=1 Tax=Povalibacter sp. TaxID=1962978 RepID=UPI002CCB269D|nr:GNAT family N-acetyltransferase [Povalibacter sp.]HMN42981.1 GNAT family N-acetyltransferase [Povalibacter sp.]
MSSFVNTPQIEVTVLDSVASVEPDEWQQLVDACPDATVFQSYEWLASWWSCFARPQDRLFLVVARCAGRLVGAAPLYERIESDGGRGAGEIRFVGEEHADYSLFIVADGMPSILHSLLRPLAAKVAAGGRAKFDEVPEFSLLGLHLLQQARTAGMSGIKWRRSSVCPRLRLDDGARAREVEEGRDVRRKLRRLEALGRVEVEHCLEPVTILELLPELFRLHEQRWRNTAYPSLFVKLSNQQFYRELVTSAARKGRVVLSLLRLDGIIVAMHLGFRSRDTIIYYKPAFDAAYEKCSPGSLLLASLASYARRSGLAWIDFSRGDEPYKRKASTLVQYNSSFEWLPSSIGQRCVETLLAANRTVRTFAASACAACERTASKQPLSVLFVGTMAHDAQAPTLAAQGAVRLKSRTADVPPRLLRWEIAITDGADLAAWLLERTDLQETDVVLPMGSALAHAFIASGPDGLRPKLLIPDAVYAPHRGIDALGDAAQRAGVPTSAAEDEYDDVQTVYRELTCVADHGSLQYYLWSGPQDGAANGAANSSDEISVAHGARRLLAQVGWHGVATLRWRCGGQGTPKLVDIQPGVSLQVEPASAEVTIFALAAAALARGERLPAQSAGVQLELSRPWSGRMGTWGGARIGGLFRSGPVPFVPLSDEFEVESAVCFFASWSL